MKSKKSLFNLTIYRKDLAQGWPFWVLYTVGMLLFPLVTGMTFHYSKQTYQDPLQNYYVSLSKILDPTILLWVAIAMGFIIALWLFSYLNRARSTNMIHALPVTRGELYLTHLLAGLTMLLVPLTITFATEIFVLLAYGVPAMFVAFEWFLLGVCLDIFFFALAVLCCMLSGNAFATVFFYVILNLLYELVWLGFALVMEIFGYGLADYIANESQSLEFLSPLLYLHNKLSVFCLYNSQADITGLQVTGFPMIFAYLAVAVLILIGGYLIYRKRHLELAGDFVAVPVIRPVIRWLVAILAGCYCGVILNTVMSSYGLRTGSVSFTVWVILFGVVGFTFAQMILKKTFRVFKKRFLIECVSCIAFAILLFAGTRTAAMLTEQNVPKAENVKDVIVNLSYDIEYSGDSVSDAIELQQWIISHKNKIYDRNRISAMNDETQVVCVSFVYNMKNGARKERDYTIIVNEASQPILQKLVATEYETDNFITYLLRDNDGTEEQNSRGSFYDFYVSKFNPENSDYSDVYLNKDASEELFEALKADADEGTIQKYVLSYQLTNDLDDYFTDFRDSYMDTLYIEYLATDSDLGMESYYYSNGVAFGPDCSHICQVLEKYKILDTSQMMTHGEYDDLMLEEE